MRYQLKHEGVFVCFGRNCHSPSKIEGNKLLSYEAILHNMVLLKQLESLEIGTKEKGSNIWVGTYIKINQSLPRNARLV